MIKYSSLIFDQKLQMGDKIALIDRNAQRKTTRAQLYALSSKVAAFAAAKKITGIVPVGMERSVEAVATLLGLNMAGVGVAPLSADVPAERARFIEKETENELWTIDTFRAAVSADVKETWEEKPASDPAVVIYTSGSTGAPKGVMLTNEGIGKALVRSARVLFQFQEDDIVLQNASFSFVAMFFDLFSPLYAGLPIHLLPEAAKKDAGLFTDYANTHGITAMFSAPKVLRLLGKIPTLRSVVVGGERLSDFAPDGYRLVNVYGLSETTGGAFCYEVTKPEQNTPIGKPMSDFTCYLLDEDGHPADEGEICFAGPIAMGYFRHPELSKSVFSENPFREKDGYPVLLRSGDMAKRREDGNLLFLNRKDFMIKINGQRVEPGETEAAIKALCDVKDAVVVGYTEADGTSFLCAYCVTDKDLDIDLLRAKLSVKVPSYMLPAYWVRLSALPLNPNGKLDRAALPRPSVNASKEEYASPLGETEKRIADAFAKVLGFSAVGATDDFFHLGGDSMKAMEAAKIIHLPHLTGTDILSGKTPRQIAKAIDVREDETSEEKKTIKDYAPLTDSQMGIYLQCMTREDGVMYNIPIRLTVKRKPEYTEAYVKNAVDAVIKNHPALYAFLKPEGEHILICRNLFPEDGICRVFTAEDLPKEDFVKPFSLFKGPLCRAEAYLTADEVRLFLDCHHIVSDGTSEKILIREIQNALDGIDPEAEDTDAFSVYEEEAERADADTVAQAEKHFETMLAGTECDSNLLFDKKPEESTSFASEIYKETLSLPGLSRYLLAEGLTQSSFFMGVFGYALAKMTGQTESLFGVAESGRKTADTDHTVSMFVKTLPMLYRLDETKSANVFLKEGQDLFYRSVQNDVISFGKLASEYGINADVLFVYQDDMLASGEGMEITSIPVKEAFANLALSIWKRGDEYVCQAEYRKDFYEEKTLERFFTLFRNAATAFAENATLKDIPLIGDSDLAILNAQNRTESPYDENETAVDFFLRSAHDYPDKTALVCRNRRYTYREVEKKVGKIAAYLHAQGIEKGQTVSILIARSEYMLIASLGALKAGAVYQPLDPSYPTERLQFMCKDADSRLLIADGDLLSLLPDYEAKILRTDEIDALPEGDYDGKPTPLDGFVLLYTSGTTGLPKGCKLLHRNVTSYVHAFNQLFDNKEDCVFAAYASFGFDAHLSEIFPPISTGAELHIVTEDIRLDLPAVKEYFEKNRVTHTIMTTQIARQFVTEYPQVQYLRSILCGGEKLVTVTPPVNYTLTNGYGPTEATVMVTCFKLDGVYADIPIGVALPNEKIYVVDTYHRRVPIGVPGELIACGPQVAGGYLNRPEKTAEVFIKNTFEPTDNPAYENAYKTGDIVRFTDNGQLEIIGRRDLQVKIRGFRIELSEVECVLREYPGVHDAAVIAVDDAAGGKCIHAYVVGPEKVDIGKLNAFIKERKPSYMVPAATMQIDAIPMTPNLKVDKRKLPEIAIEISDSTSKSRQMTALEEELCDILAGIVGHHRFDVETEFTDAGITSISSIRLAVQIFKRFGLSVTSKDLLDGGNILSVENAVVSMFLSGKENKKEAENIRDAYPLTQSQLGIYTDSLSRGADTYLMPFLLELSPDLDIEKLKSAVKTAVKAHTSLLCTIYPGEDGLPLLHPSPDLPVEVEESNEGLDYEPTHFKFEKEKLFRFRILKDNGKRYFLIEIHHIAADGESIGVLLRDIADAYRGETLQAEEYTVFTLADEEEKARAGRDFETAKAYYDSVFLGVSADYLPSPDRFSERKFGELSVPVETEGGKITSFCRDNGISESVFFTGVFAMTLSKFTSHADALFATVHNGRGDPRSENLVAMTVKTIPVYTEISPDTSVFDFLHGLDERINKLKKYDVFSFADAARKYGIAPEPMFIYQGALMQENPLGNALKPKTAPVSKVELSIEANVIENGFSLHAEYNAGRYSDVLVGNFLDAMSVCADAFIREKRLGDVSVLSERAYLDFSSFNDTDVTIAEQPAYKLFENSVDRHPDKTAVLDSGTSLTYRELDNMANDCAEMIVALGLPRESTVALMFERTADIYVSEIGVLKSGGAFLFLSPDYPDERIGFILEDASVNALITTRALYAKRQELFAHRSLPVLFTDDIDKTTKAPRLGLPVDFESLAYLIYTSGSTGKPKGVTVLQKGLVTIADANEKNRDTLKFANDEAVSTAVSAFTFDASLMEGFVALANGSTVCIAGDNEIHDPDAFCRFCLTHRVTSIFGTPSFLLNVSDCPAFSEVAKNLTCILGGGEEFTPALFDRLYGQNPRLCIINGYGPSEATVTCSSVQLQKGKRITVGKPLANTKLYCLDAQNHILPKGALGELTIVGDGVGKGYLGRPDLTEKAFIRIEGKSAFKTGDLAIVTNEDEVEFHGRLDNQVKIRGLRVELGEIEAVVQTVPDITRCVVVVKGSGENKYLAAYFTAKRTVETQEIVEVISKKLTNYMIPRNFMQLEKMPMTANGKIDKKALPEIILQKEKRTCGAAMTKTEKEICELFASILHIDEVLPSDNFFDMGGNSLLASRAVMMLKSKGYELEYQTVFDCQTPKELAAFIGKEDDKSDGSAAFDAADPTDPVLRETLKYNTLAFAEETERTPLGDVLLTGAVGFLGTHVLKVLLDSEKGHIFCLVRKGSFPSAKKRLDSVSFYYFGKCLSEQYKERLTVIDADITSENLLSVMKPYRFDTVINCAASVKHYASDNSIEYINVHGVENLIALAKAKNAKLIQISTTSVVGVHTEESYKNRTVLHENQLFVADQMNNQYVLSKYHAELAMLKAMREGMRGKIIRVGNLMGRFSDGEFQMNMGSNAFLNALKGFTVIGKFPVGHSTEPMEFSPVDCTARAIVALAGVNDKFTLFHANSRFGFDEMLLMQACGRVGLPIVPTPDKAYYEEYQTLLGDPALNKYLSALVTNDRPGIHSVEVDNTFTANVLYRIGFSWPFIDDAYLERVIKSLRELGFFDWKY